MGNKSKKKNISDKVVKTVGKLYARMAEMEIALFQAGVKAEALSALLIEKEIFNETELNNLCNKIAEEINEMQKNNAKQPELSITEQDVNETSDSNKEAATEIENEVKNIEISE